MISASAGAHMQPCGSYEHFVERLRDRYSEERHAMGVDPRGQLIELHVGPRGSWTLLSVSASGFACIMATGQGWTPVEPEPRPGEPS